MGGASSSASKRLEEKVAFDQNEMQRLHKRFKQIKKLDRGAKGKKIVTEKALQKAIPDNAEFAGRLHAWMRKQGIAEEVNFEAFLACAELLAREPEEFALPAYNNGRRLDKLELILMINLGIDKVMTEDELVRETISSSEAIRYLKSLLNMIPGEVADPDDSGVRVLLSTIMAGGDATGLDYAEFLTKLRRILRAANTVITRYFSWLFLGEPGLAQPEMERPSQLLSKELIALLFLTHEPIHPSTHKIYLLYSSAASGLSLPRLSYGLKGYTGPTLLVFRHTSRFDAGRSSCVFAAFNPIEWKDDPNAANGNFDTCIFALTPHLRVCSTRPSEPSRAFAYLNTERTSAPKGLGIGGSELGGGRNCRIWIGEDIEGGSTVLSQDDTFEPGSLLESFVSRVNIDLVEVWGLGLIGDLHNQETWRRANPPPREKTPYPEQTTLPPAPAPAPTKLHDAIAAAKTLERSLSPPERAQLKPLAAPLPAVYKAPKPLVTEERSYLYKDISFGNEFSSIQDKSFLPPQLNLPDLPSSRVPLWTETQPKGRATTSGPAAPLRYNTTTTGSDLILADYGAGAPPGRFSARASSRDEYSRVPVTPPRDSRDYNSPSPLQRGRTDQLPQARPNEGLSIPLRTESTTSLRSVTQERRVIAPATTSNRESRKNRYNTPKDAPTLPSYNEPLISNDL